MRSEAKPTRITLPVLIYYNACSATLVLHLDSLAAADALFSFETKNKQNITHAADKLFLEAIVIIIVVAVDFDKTKFGCLKKKTKCFSFLCSSKPDIYEKSVRHAPYICIII